jgi:8-oxo-dGTP pyrophosphatase MutT (NUDIX family)
MSFEHAACVLLPTLNRLEEVLAVSRRNDFTKWGIPGGKSGWYETSWDTAIREIREETQLVLQCAHLHPIYSGPCHGADGRNFWVTTYLYGAELNPMPMPEEGFQLKPMHIDELCDIHVSPFAAYNQKVREAWRTFHKA